MEGGPTSWAGNSAGPRCWSGSVVPLESILSKCIIIHRIPSIYMCLSGAQLMGRMVDLCQPLSFSCETIFILSLCFLGQHPENSSEDPAGAWLKVMWKSLQYQKVSEFWHHNHAAQCYGTGNGPGWLHPPVALVAETYADGWLVKGFSRSMMGGYHAKGLMIGRCALSPNWR